MKEKRGVVVNALRERVKTNVPGFDELVEGGFIRRSVNLVSGGPGTGKTLFCMQFLYEGAKMGENGLLLTFEEAVNKIREDAIAMGWDISGLEEQGKLLVLSLQNPLGNPGLKAQLSETIHRQNISRVVIDSISVFSVLFKGNESLLRNELYKFLGLLCELDCTVVVTSEIAGEAPLDISSGGTALSRDGVIEFVADSVITLHNCGIGGEGDRAIRVLKMRRTNHQKGPVPMEITEKGVKILTKNL